MVRPIFDLTIADQSQRFDHEKHGSDILTAWYSYPPIITVDPGWCRLSKVNARYNEAKFSRFQDESNAMSIVPECNLSIQINFSHACPNSLQLNIHFLTTREQVNNSTHRTGHPSQHGFSLSYIIFNQLNNPKVSWTCTHSDVQTGSLCFVISVFLSWSLL